MVWEQRWHPLRREWVVISSHRDRRPWQGETVGDARAPRVDYDPGCYLCPGNTRVSGERNPAYDGVFAFDNDHPCVGPDAPDPEALPTGPYQVRRADGLSRVVCYSPRHDRSLAELRITRSSGCSRSYSGSSGSWRRDARCGTSSCSRTRAKS